jgi:hypothetical protein
VGLWNRSAMRRFGWFFLVTSIVLVAKNYGMPLVNWVGELPVLNLIDFPQYSAPALGLSVAVMGGVGLDWLSREERRGWLPGLVALAFVGLLLGWLVWLNRLVMPSLPPTHRWVQLAFPGVLVLVSAGIVLAVGQGRLRPRTGTVLLAALIAAELFAFTVPMKSQVAPLLRVAGGSEAFKFVDRPRRYDTFTPPPFVEFLKRDRSVYRVLGLNYILHTNTGMAFDVDDIRGLTATTVERYLLLVEEFLKDQPGHRFTRAFTEDLTSGSPDPSLADNPVLDLLNVKYLIAPPPRGGGESPTGDSRGPSSQFRLVYRGEVRVYENLRAFPRAFVVHRAEVVAGPEEAVERMRRPGFDPARTALIEGEIPDAQLAAMGTVPEEDGSSVQIDRYEDDRVDLVARLENAGLLVLSDSYYPGWKAYVDGRERPIHPTDAALRSVFLEAGTHEVTFVYGPPSFTAGAAISALAVLALAGYGLVSRIRRRRARRARELSSNGAG